MATKGKKKHKFVKAWIHEHVNDPWVKEATRLGYRSRAAFKLIELADKDKLIRPGMRIVDLGAAPGSWTQVLRERRGADAAHRRHRPPADGADSRRELRPGRFSRGRRPEKAGKCARRAQGGPCGFGPVPQSVGRGSRRTRRVPCISATWRSNLPCMAATRRRSRGQGVSGSRLRVRSARWRGVSRRSTCASRRRRGTAAARSIWSPRAKTLTACGQFERLSPKGDMRLA